MFMRGRDEGLAAQSLYETLAPADQARLDKALASSPDLAAELAAWRRVVESVPADAPAPLPSIDLLPALQARLAAEIAPRPAVSAAPWRVAVFGGGCLAALALFGALLYRPAMNDGAPGQANVAQADAVGAAFAEAAALADGGDYAGAYGALRAAVDNHPESPLRAEAVLRMADLAFGDLQRYDLALEDYRAFRDGYSAEYVMHPDRNTVRERLEVLEETRDAAFAPLYRMAGAARRGESALGELEAVMAAHPAMYVADLAAETMASILAPEAAPGSPEFVQAMASAKDRCTNPAALAQLELSIGRYYLDTLAQEAEAVPHLEAAAESGEIAVAKAAQSTLARLGVQP